MRGLAWLLGAGALIGAGGFLMTQGDAGAAAHKKRDSLAFPTHQRAAEATRATARHTLAAPVAAPAKAGVAAAAAQDPLLVAIAPDAEDALVFEAGTILHAPVGQAMLGCMGATERARMDRHLREQGKSWLDLADRVAFSRVAGAHGMLIVDGKLGDVDWAKLAPEATTRTYGAGGTTVYEVEREDGLGSFHAAVWHGSLLMAASEAAPVEGAIDRLDAGGGGKLAFDESEAYGEIYGVVGRQAIENMLPEELRERAHEVTNRATIHVDAVEEVLLVADVEGSDVKQVEDLGKSIGAAVAVGRLQAKTDGNDDLVRLLDLSRVRPFGDGKLRAEVAIPTELMTKHMKGCQRE